MQLIVLEHTDFQFSSLIIIAAILMHLANRSRKAPGQTTISKTIGTEREPPKPEVLRQLETK